MKRSTNRILTSHTGSLPRPADLIEMIRDAEAGKPLDPAVFEARLRSAVAETVQKQLDAVANVMKDEYEAIANAGFLLQLDCPDLAMSRHSRFAGLSTEEFRKVAALHIDVLNEATKNISPDSMRLHLCWGNYEGPHHL